MLRWFGSRSSYVKNVLTLVTGTGLAQIIPILISPILTRIYSPEDFGVFALFVAIASVVSVIISGRYELAILLPKLDRNGFHVLVLALTVSCVVSFFLFLIVLIFSDELALYFDLGQAQEWLIWMPIFILFMSWYQSLNYWCTRKALYRKLALNRVNQSASASIVQVGVGQFFSASPTGLVSGQIIGQALAVATLSSSIYKENKLEIRKIKLSRVVFFAKKYIDFPKYLIVAHGFNAASSQLPVMLFGVLFNATVAGWYSLTLRVLMAPIGLVSGALGDVFRQEASLAYRKNGSCTKIYIETFRRLVFLSVIPFAILYVTAPTLFAMVFGEKWIVAGVYAQILTPMFFLRFVISPLSSMFMIAEAQRLDLAWQVGLFLIVLGSILIGAWYWDEEVALWVFSVGYSVMYVINGLLSYRLSKGNIL